MGRLDGLAQQLPDPDLFLYFYIRKEAVLSSQIEGTQSSLSDLLLFENDAVPGGFQFGRDVSGIFGVPPRNVFLVKLSYWLNY